MKQKAHDKPEPIEAQGLPATADRHPEASGQTLKPESGADTKPGCHTDSEDLSYMKQR